MGSRQHRCTLSVLSALALAIAGATSASATAGPVSGHAPIGPPSSQVLAPNAPAEPDAGPDAAATNCAPAPYGVHYYAPGTGKTVALTFDDGPGPSTEAILNILQSNHISATFFNIGANMAVRPSAVQDEATLGFALGNHTWDHPEMPFQSPSGQASEMDRQIAEQQSILGTAPCAFRPPYGEYNDTTLQLAQARNMTVWNWSVDTEDWKADGSSSSYWVNRISSRAIAGGSQTHPVILMHNSAVGNPATVAALPSIISYYRSQGYSFVDLVPPITTPGVVRGNQWLLRNSSTPGAPQVSFAYGNTTDQPVVGDWDGNGTFTPGVVRGNVWYLRNSNTSGAADIVFNYGNVTGDKFVVGDWDGNGTWTPGVVRGITWLLRNSNSAGGANVTFDYGNPKDVPVVGDWDGNGTVTPGVVRGITWLLRNGNSAGGANLTFDYGNPKDVPVVGDWDGNKTYTPGVVRGVTWYLRNSNSAGGADHTFPYGNATDKFVAADWNG